MAGTVPIVLDRGGGVALGLGGAAQPVEGASLGDGRRGHLAQGLEMSRGTGRVVQLHEGCPAGEEFRIDLALAGGKAVAGHGVIGSLAVAPLKGINEIVAALAPQGVLALGVCRCRGKGAQEGEALGLTVL